MLNIKVRIHYVPLTDLAFGVAVREACLVASLAGVDIDSPDAARVAEEHLGMHGYPNVEIRLFRTVDEYRSRATNWLVRRDGPRGATPGRRVSVSTQHGGRKGSLPVGESSDGSLLVSSRGSRSTEALQAMTAGDGVP